MFSTRIVAVATAACLLAGVGTAAASPASAPRTSLASPAPLAEFGNGSFEPIDTGRYGPGQPLGSTMGLWEVTQGNVDLAGSQFWLAAQGEKSLDLNGTTPGTISQTFTTVPGSLYTVTFSLAGNDGLPPVKRGSVFVDFQNVYNFAFDTTGTTPTDMKWVDNTFTFVAANDATTLAFSSNTPNTDRGPVIDNIRISFCPGTS